MALAQFILAIVALFAVALIATSVFVCWMTEDMLETYIVDWGGGWVVLGGVVVFSLASITLAILTLIAGK